MKRRVKGSPDSTGGQFAPDTRGATNVPVPSDIPVAQGEGSQNIASYARNLGSAYEVYSEQAKTRSMGTFTCRFCGTLSVGTDMHVQCCPDGTPCTVFEAPYKSDNWANESVVFGYKNSYHGEVLKDEAVVYLPSRSLLRAAMGKGEVLITVQETMMAPDENGMFNPTKAAYGPFFIRGTVRVWQDPYTGVVTVNTRELKCDCLQYRNTYHCSHVDFVVQGVQQRCEGTLTSRLGKGRRVNDAAREAAMRVASSMSRAVGKDWTRNPVQAAEAARMWRADSDVLYSGDPDAFLSDVEAAANRRRNNEPLVPYMTVNALDGMCQRGDGQAFGIEIEFDFPDSIIENRMDCEARRSTIAEQLYAAGITLSYRQEEYGYSDKRGFRDVHTDEYGHGTWCFEMDGSVAGEVVSPAMYDEPETWNKLATVVRILKANGATASMHAGSHVHVGTAGYGSDPASYAELARLVTQHEDVLARLSSDPARGTHRNNGYAAPLPPPPPEGFACIADAVRWQNKGSGRGSFVNMDNCTWETNRNHVEFRSFDATLDEGVIQMQVKLAVGMVNAAARNAEAGGTTRGKEPWGSHANRRNLTVMQGLPVEERLGKRNTRQNMLEESTTTRSFLDTVFRRREDKAQAAAVYSATEWSAPWLAAAHYEFS